MKLPDINNCIVSIIGLGYVGFPLAFELSKPQTIPNKSLINRKVIGFDINEERIKQLKEGYVKDGYKSDKISHLVQFFQVITIDEDKLTYVAYTATGKEYDRIVIAKDFESGEKKFYKKNEDPK